MLRRSVGPPYDATYKRLAHVVHRLHHKNAPRPTSFNAETYESNPDVLCGASIATLFEKKGILRGHAEPCE